jgi:hypothetical protein
MRSNALAVGMLVVLPSINLLRVEIHRRQTHIQILSQRQPDLATTVLRAVEFPIGDPAFFKTLLDVFAEVLVVRIVWAIVLVESFFEGFAGSTARLLVGWDEESGWWQAALYKSLISCRNSRERSASFWAVGKDAMSIPLGLPS